MQVSKHASAWCAASKACSVVGLSMRSYQVSITTMHIALLQERALTSDERKALVAFLQTL